MWLTYRVRQPRATEDLDGDEYSVLEVAIISQAQAFILRTQYLMDMLLKVMRAHNTIAGIMDQHPTLEDKYKALFDHQTTRFDIGSWIKVVEYRARIDLSIVLDIVEFIEIPLNSDIRSLSQAKTLIMRLLGGNSHSGYVLDDENRDIFIRKDDVLSLPRKIRDAL